MDDIDSSNQRCTGFRERPIAVVEVGCIGHGTIELDARIVDDQQVDEGVVIQVQPHPWKLGRIPPKCLMRQRGR